METTKNSSKSPKNENLIYNNNIKYEIFLPKNYDDNILQKYDNVVYHCGLYAYDVATQAEVDKTIIENNFNPNGFIDKRTYVAKTDETTRFTIDSFKIQTVYGNVNSTTGVASYQIEITIKETFSCMLGNALEYMAIGMHGQKGYINRPYFFEVWFSGYEKIENGGRPVNKIPLGNGKDTITYYGTISECKSRVEEDTTTWNIVFIPMRESMLTKYTNILYVSSSLKDNKLASIDKFLEACIDDMYNRFILQCPEEDREAIKIKYNGSKNFIKIKFLDENGNDINPTNIKINQGDTPVEDKIGTTNQKTDSKESFINLCKDFLYNSDSDYRLYDMRFDIKSKLKEYYDNIPLLEHNVDIYLIKDDYVEALFKYIKNGEKPKGLEDIKSKLLQKNFSEKSICKKYQYAFSGEDTSVISMDNVFDFLYFMNALPAKANIYNLNNPDVNVETPNNNNSGNTTNQMNDPKNANQISDSGTKLLENYLQNVIKFNDNAIKRTVSLNDDLYDYIKRNSAQGDEKKKDVDAIIIKGIWNNLYKSGQMSMSTIEILGDPFWLISSSLNSPTNITKAVNDMMRYRYVFLLRTCPSFDKLGIYDNYTFDYSMTASGIYIAISSESTFSDGIFKQRLKGAIDKKFIEGF